MRDSCIFTSSWFVFYGYVVIWKQNCGIMRWIMRVRRLILLIYYGRACSFETILNFLFIPANNDNIDYCITKKHAGTIVHMSRVKLYLITARNYRTYRFYPRGATSRTFSCTISLDCFPWLPKSNLSREYWENCIARRDVKQSLIYNAIIKNRDVNNFFSQTIAG